MLATAPTAAFGLPSPPSSMFLQLVVRDRSTVRVMEVVLRSRRWRRSRCHQLCCCRSPWPPAGPILNQANDRGRQQPW